MKNKKKTFIIIGCVVAAIIIVIAILSLRKANTGSKVYVMPVKEVVSTDNGTVNRYSGVVEPQLTIEYKLDSNKTVKKTYVQEGDSVKKGDKLFSYDTNSIALDIEQINIDIQRLNAQIENNNKQIKELQEMANHASSSEQLEYSLNIQQLQNDNLSTSYSIKAKQNELATKKESLKNTDVVSDVDGIVKSVDNTGYSESYITVMQDGDFLIKATINEMNIYQMVEGTKVKVYSRIDDSSWTGTVLKIDTSSVNSSNNGMYYGNDEMASSSKYSFYVQLDDDEGLFLGQHVIIMPAIIKNKTGLWLSEYYIGDVDTKPFVYKDSNGKIKKQYIELGQYDENLFEYEVLSGLTIDDYIAYLDENIIEGSKTTTEYVVEEDPGFSEESYFEETYELDDALINETFDGVIEETIEE